MSFKIAHLSDLHLGYRSTVHVNSQGVNLREADGYLSFMKIVKDIIDEEVDAVIVAGDTFHTFNPDIRTLTFAQTQFQRFFKAGIPVYILAGNHDTNDIRADVAASKILHDPARRIFSFAEPYVQKKIGEDIYLHLVSHHMYTDQGSTMENLSPVKDAINIFSTHGSIIDPLLKIRLHTEQSPREIVIPDFVLNDYDWSYIMMGHIHERGWAGSSPGSKKDSAGHKVYYNGSLIRRGFSDKESPLGRGWTLWTIREDGTFTPDFRTVAQRKQVDFPIIDALQLTPQQISEKIIENLHSVQTDDLESFDPLTAPILRQRFMNIEGAKRSSLDWKAINANKKFALQWTPQFLSEAVIKAEEELEIDPALSSNKDIVSIFDDWIKKSDNLSKTDESIKEIVTKQTRDFIEQGQEEILNESN